MAALFAFPFRKSSIKSLGKLTTGFFIGSTDLFLTSNFFEFVLAFLNDGSFGVILFVAFFGGVYPGIDNLWMSTDILVYNGFTVMMGSSYFRLISPSYGALSLNPSSREYLL